MKFLKRMFDEKPRLMWGMVWLLVVVAQEILFALPIGLVIGNVWSCIQLWFWLFCAPFVVGAILVWVTRLQEDTALIYGCGLYYGMIGIVVLIDKIGWRMETEAKYVISFAVAALACYVVYLKRGKK